MSCRHTGVVASPSPARWMLPLRKTASGWRDDGGRQVGGGGEVLGRKYERHGAQHIYSVVGKFAGLHFWVEYISSRHLLGGVEIHYRQPPSYMLDDPPSNEHCWLLGGPCWHDGSSLRASEEFIPVWLSLGSEDVEQGETMFA